MIKQLRKIYYGIKPMTNRGIISMLLCMTVSSCLVLLMVVTAQADQDQVLQQSGIRYPEGFDVNTVGEIKGTVSNVFKPDKGPIRFTLTSRMDKYTVFTAPLWYLEDISLSLIDGQELMVIGSKSLGKDGNLYIIAQDLTILSSGRSYSLRSNIGMPLWSGGSMSGVGGPMRRIGERGFRGGSGGGQGRR